MIASTQKSAPEVKNSVLGSGNKQDNICMCGKNK